MRKKRIFWTDDVDIECYRESYIELYDRTPTNEELYDYAYNCGQLEYDDTYDALDKSDRYDILVLADIGTWRGRVKGYKIMRNVRLSRIMNCCSADNYELYSTAYNVCGKAEHHDGTNFLEFRIIRDNICLYKLEELLFDSYINSNKGLSRSQINYYTMSMLPDVNRLLMY